MVNVCYVVVAYNIPITEIDNDKVCQIQLQYNKFSKVFDRTDLSTQIRLLIYNRSNIGYILM